MNDTENSFENIGKQNEGIPEQTGSPEAGMQTQVVPALEKTRTATPRRRRSDRYHEAARDPEKAPGSADETENAAAREQSGRPAACSPAVTDPLSAEL